MTLKEAYEAVLIELNKVQAPSILLDDFNYLFNKAIQKYFNKRYSQYEINQQLTDDLRVLVKTEKLSPTDTEIRGDSYRFNLPAHYVHILNCICEFEMMNNVDCGCDDDNPCKLVKVGANKLTTNQWSQVITNYYMRPSMKQPYYYIQNYADPAMIGEDPTNKTQQWDPIKNSTTRDRQTGKRYGNKLQPVLEIKCGVLNPNEVKSLSVYIDYLQAPEYLELKQDDLDDWTDTTVELEFPDYVIYEIINELVMSIMENARDPRIQTFPAVNTTIPQQMQRS